MKFMCVLLFFSVICNAGEYSAHVLRVLDGDTIEAQINLGFETSVKKTIRVRGIDAPEKNTDAGKKSAAFLASLITGKIVVLTTNPKNEYEKYGRVLAEVRHAGVSITELMIKEGLAKAYDGKGPR